MRAGAVRGGAPAPRQATSPRRRPYDAYSDSYAEAGATGGGAPRGLRRGTGSRAGGLMETGGSGPLQLSPPTRPPTPSGSRQSRRRRRWASECAGAPVDARRQAAVACAGRVPGGYTYHTRDFYSHSCRRTGVGAKGATRGGPTTARALARAARTSREPDGQHSGGAKQRGPSRTAEGEAGGGRREARGARREDADLAAQQSSTCSERAARINAWGRRAAGLAVSGGWRAGCQQPAGRYKFYLGGCACVGPVVATSGRTCTRVNLLGSIAAASRPPAPASETGACSRAACVAITGASTCT